MALTVDEKREFLTGRIKELEFDRLGHEVNGEPDPAAVAVIDERLARLRAAVAELG